MSHERLYVSRHRRGENLGLYLVLTTARGGTGMLLLGGGLDPLAAGMLLLGGGSGPPISILLDHHGRFRRAVGFARWVWAYSGVVGVDGWLGCYPHQASGSSA